jgi:hypothetical protein
VPHFPARQERRGVTLAGCAGARSASHLVYCGLIARRARQRWIIRDYEDNLFISEGYGYQATDFERQWFHLGGFSMQSNLLLFPPLYQYRDEPKHYLRGYFNAFTSAFFPDTMTMCEQALPNLEQWRGDHFKSSDEANSNGWLRGMFLSENKQELFIVKHTAPLVRARQNNESRTRRYPLWRDQPGIHITGRDRNHHRPP